MAGDGGLEPPASGFGGISDMSYHLAMYDFMVCIIASNIDWYII